MIFLPPLGAPKRHRITHHCIEITNNKSSTACSRCHRRRGSRCRCCCSRSCCCSCGGRRERSRSRRRRRALTVNESGALVRVGGGSELKERIGIARHIEVHAKGAKVGVELARNEDVATRPGEVASRI